MSYLNFNFINKNVWSYDTVFDSTKFKEQRLLNARTMLDFSSRFYMNDRLFNRYVKQHILYRLLKIKPNLRSLKKFFKFESENIRVFDTNSKISDNVFFIIIDIFKKLKLFSKNNFRYFQTIYGFDYALTYLYNYSTFNMNFYNSNIFFKFVNKLFVHETISLRKYRLPLLNLSNLLFQFKNMFFFISLFYKFYINIFRKIYKIVFACCEERPLETKRHLFFFLRGFNIRIINQIFFIPNIILKFGFHISNFFSSFFLHFIPFFFSFFTNNKFLNPICLSDFKHHISGTRLDRRSLYKRYFPVNFINHVFAQYISIINFSSCWIESFSKIHPLFRSFVDLTAELDYRNLNLLYFGVNDLQLLESKLFSKNEYMRFIFFFMFYKVNLRVMYNLYRKHCKNTYTVSLLNFNSFATTVSFRLENLNKYTALNFFHMKNSFNRFSRKFSVVKNRKNFFLHYTLLKQLINFAMHAGGRQKSLKIHRNLFLMLKTRLATTLGSVALIAALSSVRLHLRTVNYTLAGKSTDIFAPLRIHTRFFWALRLFSEGVRFRIKKLIAEGYEHEATLPFALFREIYDIAYSKWDSGSVRKRRDYNIYFTAVRMLISRKPPTLEFDPTYYSSLYRSAFFSRRHARMAKRLKRLKALDTLQLKNNIMSNSFNFETPQVVRKKNTYFGNKKSTYSFKRSKNKCNKK